MDLFNSGGSEMASLDCFVEIFRVEADSQASIFLPAVRYAVDPGGGLSHLADDSRPFHTIQLTFHFIVQLDWTAPVPMYN